jgi:hypothetical protein
MSPPAGAGKPSMNQKLRQGEEKKHHIPGSKYQEALILNFSKERSSHPLELLLSTPSTFRDPGYAWFMGNCSGKPLRSE